MVEEKNISIKAAALFSYIFTLLTLFISYGYTVDYKVNGFKVIEANDIIQHSSNAISLIVLVLSWLGAITFLSISIMLTIFWIKED